MAFRVEQTDAADTDLDTMLKWLGEQGAGEYGMRWFRKLREAIASLAELPHRCPFAPENAEFPFEVRQLLYGRKPHWYRVLFTIDGDVVVILHIRHGRRQRLSESH
jgi:plasmid stabilization system protein ParE